MDDTQYLKFKDKFEEKLAARLAKVPGAYSAFIGGIILSTRTSEKAKREIAEYVYSHEDATTDDILECAADAEGIERLW